MFARGLWALGMTSLLLGCAEKGAEDPHGFIAQQTPRASSGASASSAAATVRVRCDEQGGLHVQSPAGSVVRVPDDANGKDAELEISLADERPRPLRVTKSLGFIGDNKLTELPSRGGPWNAPDAVLPPHTHSRGYAYGYGGGGYGGYPAYRTWR